MPRLHFDTTSHPGEDGGLPWSLLSSRIPPVNVIVFSCPLIARAAVAPPPDEEALARSYSIAHKLYHRQCNRRTIVFVVVLVVVPSHGLLKHNQTALVATRPDRGDFRSKQLDVTSR